MSMDERIAFVCGAVFGVIVFVGVLPYLLWACGMGLEIYR